MDAQGVDIQLVSPSPSHYHYWAESQLAATVCRLANEGTAAHCAKAPDRLHGLGLVPLQHPVLAVELLDHALEQGLRGVEISSHAPGRELSDPAYEPLWSRAEETGALLLLHPFGCTLDERLDQWYLSNTVGQPTENAVALSHLIFSGVLDRHPGLKLIAAHGGGYLPTHIGRSDHAWRSRPDTHGCAREPSSYLRRFHYDSLVHDPYVLR
jgi:aminocarboxymuconate-semialdehyde decarboxylase